MATEVVGTLKAEGNALFKSGQFDDAIECYRRCLASTPADDSDSLLVVNRNLAQALINVKQFTLALEASDAALSICPADVKALYRRALAYEGLCQWNGALQDARRLLSIDPSNKPGQELARRLEARVHRLVDEANSMSGKINSMFDILAQFNDDSHLDQSTVDDDDEDKCHKAIANLSSLIRQTPSAGHAVWQHEKSALIYSLCKKPISLKLKAALHSLLTHLFHSSTEKSLIVLSRLSASYFVDGILSRHPAESLELCRFVNSLLDGLTQLTSYTQLTAKQDHEKQKKSDACLSAKVAPDGHARFKLDPNVEQAVFDILTNLLRFIDFGRLHAKTRDSLLEILVRFVPRDTGIGFSRKAFQLDGALDRLFEVGAAAGTTSLADWRSQRKRKTDNTDNSTATASDCQLRTTPNTRMLVACLLAKLWSDLGSDKLRAEFTDQCQNFIMYLFTDPFLESKVEAASLIGTLFLGPYEVGASVMSNPGVLKGLLLLTKNPNMLYQTIALDTVILAINKKERCIGLLDQLVPCLREMYKSENNGTKIRALVALCKLAVLGGSDVSIQSLTKGSSLALVNACRSLLSGNTQSAADVDQFVNPSKSANVQIKQLQSDNPLQVVEEEEEEDDDQMISVKSQLTSATLPLTELKDSQTARWALEGLSYLTLDAEVKQLVIADANLIKLMFDATATGLHDFAFALVSILANLANCSFDADQQANIEPELIELAKFAKQHIPQKHELDAEGPVKRRRQTLIDAGLPTVLFNLTTRLLVGPIHGQPGLRELVSRLYLMTSEQVDNRGRIIQTGAGKALLRLTVDQNTDAGKSMAAQALARVCISADPRLSFPGQRSLDIVSPLLKLLNLDNTSLQNFEAMLALTNLASLSENHRHRIIAERGLPLLDHFLFDDHPMLRRAACECFANLAQSPLFVRSCGGELPLTASEVELGSNLTYVKSPTERVKLLVHYCCLTYEDLLLTSAASGALATMSHDPGIIKLITGTTDWVETLQTLAGHDAPCLQHRASHILANMLTHGDQSLVEWMASNNMFEVILSLSQLPDLTEDQLTAIEPSLRLAYPSHLTVSTSKQALYDAARHDRKLTRECAVRGIDRWLQLGLIESASINAGTGSYQRRLRPAAV